MIGLALALLAQAMPAGPPLDAQEARDGFLSICVRHVADPDALRAAIRRSPFGFARAASEGAFEIYRAARATIRFEPGRGCGFDARLTSRGEGHRAIDLVSVATGLPRPRGGVNRGGSGALYFWQSPAAGGAGLSASLDWGRLGAPEATPVLLSLWTYSRPAP